MPCSLSYKVIGSCAFSDVLLAGGEPPLAELLESLQRIIRVDLRLVAREAGTPLPQVVLARLLPLRAPLSQAPAAFVQYLGSSGRAAARDAEGPHFQELIQIPDSASRLHLDVRRGMFSH